MAEFTEFCIRNVKFDPEREEVGGWLKEQSARVQEVLNSHLGPAKSSASKAFLVGLLTCKHEELPSRRKTSIDPLCYYSDHRKVANLLAAYVGSKRQSRFYTAYVTAGEPVGLSAVRDRANSLLDRVRRINQLPYFKKNQIEVIVRVLDISKSESTGADPESKFHEHLHLVIEQSGKSGPLSFKQIELELRRVYGAVSGVESLSVDRPKIPLFRYILKPLPVGALSDAEILEFYRIFKRRRLVQCSGSFQEFRRELKETNCSVCETQDGGVEIIERVRPISFPEDRESTSDNEDASQSSSPTKEKQPSKPPLWSSIVVHVLPPGFYFAETKLREPALLVLDYNGNFEELLRKHSSLKDLQRRCLDALEGREPGPSRHSTPLPQSTIRSGPR